MLVPQYPFFIHLDNDEIEVYSTISGLKIGGLHGGRLYDGSLLFLPYVGDKATTFPLPYVKFEKQEGKILISFAGAPSISVDKFEQNTHDTLLKEISLQKVKHYELSVDKHLTTGIPVELGDHVAISASGTIQLTSAVKSGPEGSEYQIDNVFYNVNFGTLTGRLNGNWFPVSKGILFKANTKGELELSVNNDDPNGIRGSYSVVVDVYSNK